MIKRALILDLETTGVDPAKDKIVEVGLILYSVEHHAVSRCMSMLVDCGAGNAAEPINRIPPKLLVDDGEGMMHAESVVQQWMGDADLVLAHNGGFDQSFLPAPLRTRLPWVDTMTDIAWPRAGLGQSLVSVALAHGVGVTSAHRALADCMLIASLLERVHELGHDLQAMLTRGLRPKATFAVADTRFDAARNALAKANGFRWDSDRKSWLRSMAKEDAAGLPFAVREVQG